MDECVHCGWRGDFAACSKGECRKHESWYVQELLAHEKQVGEEVRRLRKGIADLRVEVDEAAKLLREALRRMDRGCDGCSNEAQCDTRPGDECRSTATLRTYLETLETKP